MIMIMIMIIIIIILSCLRYYIQEFTQRNVGWQLLPAQIFTASDIPLKLIDFSNNAMRRLVERLFDGMEDTLEEIYLSNNKLGDNLSPVFSTGEFQNLKFLRVLDLSYNGIRGISENLIKGCTELKVKLFSFILPFFLFYSALYPSYISPLFKCLLLSLHPPSRFILLLASTFS